VDISVGKIVGVDINPVMLSIARHCSVGKHIEWKEGSAMSLSFPNESFDLMICQQGLQFFPDKIEAPLCSSHNSLIPTKSILSI
jgi:ubiquinone/menaquinone biosynthesis C-methylase UbiE